MASRALWMTGQTVMPYHSDASPLPRLAGVPGLAGPTARNPSTPAGTLASLASSAEMLVRMEVALTAATPADVRAELAKDPDAWVRQAATTGVRPPVPWPA